MKKRILLSLLWLALILVPVYLVFFVERRTREKVMEKNRIDSLVRIEVEKFSALLRHNERIADSIVADINKERRMNGKPDLNIPVNGEITQSSDPMFEYLGSFTMYGSVRLDSLDSNYCEGILFDLYNPEKIHHLKFFKRDDRFYKSFSTEQYRIYKMWLREPEVLEGEFMEIR